MSARLFAAVDLPDAVRERLAGFGRACADCDPALRAVAPDALHVTLAFLGHRPLEDVAPACVAVRGVTPSHVALELDAALWLSPRRPHVLSVALADPDGGLARLHSEVGAALADAVDWRPEQRAFRPHVTVARVRRGTPPRRRGLPQTPEEDFAAVALTLYRSHLGGGPARYEALARVPLP